MEILPWQSNVPRDLPRDVLARHASLLAALPERTRVLHLRLDPLPRDTALPVACAPRLAGATQFRDAIVRALQREPPLPSGSDPRVAVQVRMLVTRDGEVAYASLSRRGPTGTIDAAILRAARGLRFVPATWEGVPSDQWVELPVRMEVPMLPPDSRRP